MIKKVGFAVIGVLIIMQFFTIDKTNPEVVLENDFIAVTNPPENVKQILQSSCYDCHSNTTKYPWYSNVAPISWWIKDHVDEARDELNFSEWATFGEERKEHKLEEMVEEVEEGEMPLKSYTIAHSGSSLSEDQARELAVWINSIR